MPGRIVSYGKDRENVHHMFGTKQHADISCQLIAAWGFHVGTRNLSRFDGVKLSCIIVIYYYILYIYYI